MKILFDTNVPAPLRGAFPTHVVVRTGELGWQALENGKLLTAAEQAGFDLVITCDQNIPDQQHFSRRKLALLVLPKNHWPTIRPFQKRIATMADFLQRGQVTWVDFESA
ncbi:MAG: hypothetical protein JST93_36520 [Acidobacteria bacterium]|nr:hypothetical protein [Acidobacteriota bacterium]